MSVHDWINGATAVETWEPFDGSLTAGTLIGSPSWVDGVDGHALSCGPNEGAVIPTTAETANGYPLSVSVWFSLPSTAASVPIFQWGNIPSVGAQVFGSDSSEVPGTVEAWVRMSNGRYALRVRSGALATNRWHCLSIVVTWKTIWGGCNATAYINGQQIGTGTYSGGLFDVVNFNRPTQVTFGTGAGSIVVDEFVTQEAALTAAGAANLYSSADSLEATASSGWGIFWS